MQVTSGCFSMEVGSDVSLSTEVSVMTLPARRQTDGPVELDEFFGLTHQFLGVLWARYTPFRLIRVPGHALFGSEDRGRQCGPGRRRAHDHRSRGPNSHGTGRRTASVSLHERTAGIARPHALNARHGGEEPKLFQAVAGIGIDRSAWEQAPISSGCHERGRDRQSVRRAGASATTRAPR
jgi:hypothetical protein